MTSTNKVINFPVDPAIWTSAQLEQTIVDALQTVEEKTKARKSPLTSSAPNLASLALNGPKKEESYVQALMEYMSAVLVSGTKQLDTQMKSVGVQENITQLQMRLIQEAQRISEAQAAAAEHSPLKTILEILSYVGAAVMIIAGAVTENPSLVIGGAAMIVMTATKAGEALANALPNEPWLKIFLIVVISVAAAFVLSYAGAALGASAGVSTGAAAAETAVTTAAEAATVAAEVSTTTATAASTTVETTATTAKAATTAAEAESGAAATIGGNTGEETAASFTAGQIASRSLLISTMFNLFGEVARELAKDANASDEAQEKAAMIAGIISAVVAVAISYKVETSAGSGAQGANGALTKVKTAIEFIVQKLPYGEKLAVKLPTILQWIMIGNSLAQAGLSINEGVFMLKQADTQFKFGKALSDINFYNDLLTQNNMMIKSDQEAIGASAKSFAKMNENWDAYAAPYRSGVENMA